MIVKKIPLISYHKSIELMHQPNFIKVQTNENG
jgi:hypothetical protein